MILVTGAAGFVGKAVVSALDMSGQTVRCLVSASGLESDTRDGNTLGVDLASVDLQGQRDLRECLVGVDTVVHLASAQRRGGWEDLMSVDYRGTRELLNAARDIGGGRFIYLSSLGAERASAFPLLRSKGIIEQFVRNCGIPYTIIRGSAVFGPEDSFTNSIVVAMKLFPFVFPKPGSGKELLQPIWIGDFAECIRQAVVDTRFARETISIGGPEFMSVDQLLQGIMGIAECSRVLVPVPLPSMRFIVGLLKRFFPNSLIATNWLDLISRDNTCEINGVHRYFGLRPARFVDKAGYLAPFARKSNL